MAQRRDARAVDEYTAHCHQQFFVQIAFAWRWRHLDRNHRKPRSSEFLIEVSAIVPQELLDDACLAHASRAIDDKARHAIARRVIDEIHQTSQDTLSARILNPALLAEPMNPLSIR